MHARCKGVWQRASLRLAKERNRASVEWPKLKEARRQRRRVRVRGAHGRWVQLPVGTRLYEIDLDEALRN